MRRAFSAVCLCFSGTWSDGEGLRSVQAGEFGDLTKGDTLRVMAASHVILAVVLIGMETPDFHG
jgi:hypothetical protein